MYRKLYELLSSMIHRENTSVLVEIHINLNAYSKTVSTFDSCQKLGSLAQWDNVITERCTVNKSFAAEMILDDFQVLRGPSARCSHPIQSSDKSQSGRQPGAACDFSGCGSVHHEESREADKDRQKY